MGFNAPPKILQKVMGFKAFAPADGKLLLFGNPVTVLPNVMKLYMFKLLERSVDVQEINKTLYHTGRLQGEAGVKIVNKRFGYAESMKDKKELLMFNLGQLEILGLGAFELVRFDLEKKLIMIKGKSSYAEEYLQFFGMTKKAVDYFLLGILTAGAEIITGFELIVTEEQCIAKGNQYCLFSARAKENIDTNNPTFQEILSFNEEKLKFLDLGAIKEPTVYN